MKFYITSKGGFWQAHKSRRSWAKGDEPVIVARSFEALKWSMEENRPAKKRFSLKWLFVLAVCAAAFVAVKGM